MSLLHARLLHARSGLAGIRRTAARCLLVAGCALPLAAGAQESGPGAPESPASETESTRYEDWALACRQMKPDEPQRCVLVQIRVLRQTGKRVLSVTVARVGEERKLMAAVTVPLGILLPAGIRLNVDDTEIIRIPLQFCRVEGCQGRFPLSDSIRASFEKGRIGKVIVRQPNGAELPIQFSLRGFTRGLAALEAR